MNSSELLKNAFIIGARETVKGFALIGVSGKVVEEREKGIDILKQALKGEYNLIVVSASLAYLIEKEIDELRKEYPTPILVISDVNTKVDMKEIENKFKMFVGI